MTTSYSSVVARNDAMASQPIALRLCGRWCVDFWSPKSPHIQCRRSFYRNCRISFHLC